MDTIKAVLLIILFFLVGVLIGTYLQKDVNKDILNPDNNVGGKYLHKDQVVILYPGRYVEEPGGFKFYQHAAMHELGHYYWDKLSEDDKMLLMKVCFNNENPFTDYSTTSVGECWAEYFAKVYEYGHMLSETDPVDQAVLEIISHLNIQ